MRLTPKQQEMLNAINDQIDHKGYAYLEFGSCKPFSFRTYDSLYDKGFLKHVKIDSCNGGFSWVNLVPSI